MNEKTLKEKLQRLNEISVMIDRPDIELEKAIELYSEGVKIAELCTKQLEEARKQIITLSIKE